MPSSKLTDEIAALEKKRSRLETKIKERKERQKNAELEQEQRRKLLTGAAADPSGATIFQVAAGGY